MRVAFLAVLCMFIFATNAKASLTYIAGTVAAVYQNGETLSINGKLYKVLTNAPIRILKQKGNGTVEVKGSRSDVTRGAYVTLHCAGHLVVDILVERR